MSLTKKVLKWTAVAAFWIVVWQLLAVAVNQEILIPTPYVTLLSLKKMIVTAKFWNSVLFSVLRILAGFLGGIVAGVLGALLSSRFSVFKTVFSPILHLIRAIPVASFIILALVWIKSNYLPTFSAFLMVMPMIWSTVETGISNIDKDYLEMARIYHLKPSKILFQIKIPFILPNFIATSLTALGFAWKSGVAAEVICKPLNSLGSMLQDSKLYLETPEIFSLTAVVAILSLLLEKVVKIVVRRFTNDKN